MLITNNYGNMRNTNKTVIPPLKAGMVNICFISIPVGYYLKI